MRITFPVTARAFFIPSLLRLFLLALTALTAACAPGSVQNPGSAKAGGAGGSSPLVAVLPLENLSTDPNAGLIVCDQMSAALTALPFPGLIPQAKVRTTLQPHEGQYLPPQEIGKMLGADAVLTGTVSEYRYVYGTGEQPALSFSLRAVATTNGRTLWSRTYTTGGSLAWIKGSSLGEATAKLCRAAAADLAKSATNAGLAR